MDHKINQTILRSNIFSYEKPAEAPRFLRTNFTVTTKKGLECQVRNVTNDDKHVFEKLFRDEKVLKHFDSTFLDYSENGTVKTFNADRFFERFTLWLKRVADGMPCAPCMICVNQTAIGYIICGGGDKPGLSEMAYALHSEYWNQGIMTAVAFFMANSWSSEVRAIGSNLNAAFQLNIDPETRKKCSDKFLFDGEVLQRLDATSSIMNFASQAVLKKVCFARALDGQSSTFMTKTLDCINNSKESLVTSLLPLYPPSSTAIYTIGTRYHCTIKKQEKDGSIIEETATMSFKAQFHNLKLHYEYYPSFI